MRLVNNTALLVMVVLLMLVGCMTGPERLVWTGGDRDETSFRRDSIECAGQVRELGLRSIVQHRDTGGGPASR